jgi:hypothetical protein
MSILSIGFTILIVVVGLFLSLWVIIPAPIFALMPLSVGAPEISPTLIAVNALGLGLSFLLFKFSPWRVSHPSRLLVLLVLSSLALILSRANSQRYNNRPIAKLCRPSVPIIRRRFRWNCRPNGDRGPCR